MPFFQKLSIGSVTTEIQKNKIDTGRRFSTFDRDILRPADVQTSDDLIRGRDKLWNHNASGHQQETSSSRSKPRKEKSLVDMYAGKQPKAEEMLYSTVHTRK